MKRAGHLFEQIADFHSLRAAARRAQRRIVLGVDAAGFLAELELNALVLQAELLDGSYRPEPYRTFHIRDPKPRTISAAPFRDRVVHHSLCAALEPVFEQYASDQSYACRRGKGTTGALARVRALARRHAFFIKLDVRSYFESIDLALLGKQLRRLIKDRRALDLAHRFLAAGAPGSPVGKGLPIGNLTSQHFANLHLGIVDHHVQSHLGLGAWCRYMDDMLLFGDDRPRLAAAGAEIAVLLADRMALALRHEACRAGRVSDGVPFLGFRIWPHHIRLDRARRLRLGRRIRGLLDAVERGTASAAEVTPAMAALLSWAANAHTRALLTTELARHEDGPRPDLRTSRPTSRTGGTSLRPHAIRLCSAGSAMDGHDLCTGAASVETARPASP